MKEVADNASETTYDYDGAGRMITITDADGNTVENTYDPNGNLIAATRTETCTIVNVTEAVDDETFSSATFYDALGRMVLIAAQGADGVLDTDLSAANNETLFTLTGYDSRGNQTLAIDPKGNTSITVYDAAGRASETHQHMRSDGDGTSGPAEASTFLAAGAATIRTQMVYDMNSRLTQLVDDAGAVTAYAYDTLDRQISQTFHDGSERTTTFSDAGDVETYIDENGSVFTYTYDAIGRKISVSISKGSGVIGTTSQTFEYDGLSRMTRSIDTDGASPAECKFYFDSLGRVIEQSQIFASNTRNVTNSAFTSTPTTSITYPDGRVIDHVYDDLYRRITTQDASAGSAPSIAEWEYFGPDRVAELTLANGLACSHMNNDRTHSAVQSGVSNPAWGSTPATDDRLGYDGTGRMITKRYVDATLNGDAYNSTTPIVGFTTEFDKSSNKLYERHLHAENRSHLYNSLDSMGRLREYQRGTLASGGASIASGLKITLQGTNEVYSWNLDSVGNWAKTTYTPVGSAETSETRQHNKLHQIVKAGSTALAHDTSGNMTDDGSRTFEYDALNRVKTVTKKSGAVLLATYTYDAMGRRIRKVITGNGLSGNITNGTTDYLYDGQQCVEQRVSDAMTKQYVWGLYIDELLEINAAGIKYYPLQDMLYRTNVLTDSSGAIFEKFDYDAYGNTLIFDASDTAKSNPVCEFLFTGRRYDTESQLYFYRARYYNPELGRFISKDPKGYEDGMNQYVYCRSMPIIGIDPSGFVTQVDDVGPGSAFDRWRDGTGGTVDILGQSFINHVKNMRAVKSHIENLEISMRFKMKRDARGVGHNGIVTAKKKMKGTFTMTGWRWAAFGTVRHNYSGVCVGTKKCLKIPVDGWCDILKYSCLYNVRGHDIYHNFENLQKAYGGYGGKALYGLLWIWGKAGSSTLDAPKPFEIRWSFQKNTSGEIGLRLAPSRRR